MRYIKWVTFLLLLIASTVQAEVDSSLQIDEGGSGKYVATEEDAGTHREVVVLRHTLTGAMNTDTVVAGASAKSIFGSGSVTCISVLIVASATNGGPVWISPVPTQDAVDGSLVAVPGGYGIGSIPLYAGTRQMFRAPNTGDCSDISVIEGVGCSACRIFVAAQ